AAIEISSSNICLIDIAVKYDFDSGDTFSRAFKRITGVLPSEFRKSNKIFNFERISILEKYFESQDKKLLEKYPDIKVLKELEPIRVAYYSYFGKNPENNAFEVMKDWLNKSGLNINGQKHRIFGHDNPSPTSEEQEEYGYEVCVTIGDDIIVNDSIIKEKVLEGGLYAVTGVKRGENGDIGNEIMMAWKRFRNWISNSKYVYGGHQWLEEHLGFDDDFNHVGGIDLYMPIIEKRSIDTNKTFENVEPIWTAAFTATGRDAADKARNYFLKWADAESLFNDINSHKIFAYYNHERIGYDDFFFKIHITIDKDFKTEDPNITLEEFKGGYYAVTKSKFKYNGGSWGEFIKWVSKSKEYDFGDFWFFEEYKINKPQIEPETDMVLYMSIKRK
ncbi:MAG: AraC family transcriptional regulator, partial [Ruminiclostridium sp.]